MQLFLSYPPGDGRELRHEDAPAFSMIRIFSRMHQHQRVARPPSFFMDIVLTARDYLLYSDSSFLNSLKGGGVMHEQLRKRVLPYQVTCIWCKIFTQPFYNARMSRHEDLECSQRLGATTRHLQKCRYCGDHFVTTRSILFEHETHCRKRAKYEYPDDGYCSCCC